MPPKNLAKIYGIAAGIVLVTIVAAVMVVISSGTQPTQLPSRGDLVRVQVRSFPAMQRVLLNGREEGKTPKMILVPRGDQPIDVQVWFGQEPVTKQVVPSEDQVVDFHK
ncbi:MAG: PEGA domain-containing protein [Kofleriaceae bacterium]